MKLAAQMDFGRRGIQTPMSFGRSNGIGIEFGVEKEDAIEVLNAADIPVSRFDPTVRMLFGRRGQGKTLGMTAFAEFQRQRFAEHGTGCLDDCEDHCFLHQRVASNYWMQPAKIINPKLVEDLSQYPQWGRKLYICVDEIQAFANNRRAMQRTSVDFIQFLTQIRKRENEIIMTTQFPQVVDPSVLFQIDLFDRMELYRGISEQTGEIGWHIQVLEWDWWGQWSGRHERKPWPPREEDADDVFTIWDVHLMFPQFKSGQIIPPTWSKARDQVIMHEFGADYEDELDLGYELTPEAAEIAAGEPIETLAQLLDAQMGAFNALGLLAHAKRLDKTIKNQAQFIKALEAHGFTVTNLDGTKMASRE